MTRIINCCQILICLFLFTLHSTCAAQPNKHACQNGCENIFNRLKNNFSEFVLFELSTITQMNFRKNSFEEIQRVGNKHGNDILNAIKRYNPSLNVQTLRKNLREIVTKSARAIILGRLDEPQTRNQIVRDFKQITNFWQKRLFRNFPKDSIDKEFAESLLIVARLNSRPRVATSAYQDLNEKILALINKIKQS